MGDIQCANRIPTRERGEIVHDMRLESLKSIIQIEQNSGTRIERRKLSERCNEAWYRRGMGGGGILHPTYSPSFAKKGARIE